MSRIANVIGSGIGLAAEATSKRKPQEPADPPPSYSSHDHSPKIEKDEDCSDDDEADWIIDDAQHVETTHEDRPSRGIKGTRSVDDLVDHFIGRHPPPIQRLASAHLDCPVILPQRRPHTKRRGFVRAYSPVLQDCGIDQATFLEYLDTFDDAIESSPWFNVVNLALISTLAIPVPGIQAATIAVRIGISAARRMQATRQGNSFVDKINDHFFRPRGLYCLLMTYKPQSSSTSAVADITGNINKAVDARESSDHGFLQSLKPSAGKTHGEIELPEAAPLIFPQYEALPEEKKQSGFKKAMELTRDYADRREQSKFEHQNAGSSLSAGHNAQFASRYGDPNDTTNQSIMGLLSGGRFNRGALKQHRRGRRRPGGMILGRIQEHRGAHKEARKQGQQGVVPRVRRYMQEDVLYMMIVNMPSEEELAAAGEVAAPHE